MWQALLSLLQGAGTSGAAGAATEGAASGASASSIMGMLGSGQKQDPKSKSPPPGDFSGIFNEPLTQQHPMASLLDLFRQQ